MLYTYINKLELFFVRKNFLIIIYFGSLKLWGFFILMIYFIILLGRYDFKIEIIFLVEIYYVKSINIV